MRGRSRAGALVVGVILCLGACSAHPVGPARTYQTYEGKAATTAESALSAVETVRLAATTGAKGHAFGAFLGGVVSDQEDGLSTTQGTFGSIQPPDGRADRLRATLDRLLSDSLDDIADVRVAIRRGDLGSLDRVAAPLRRDADALRTFVEDHG